MTTFPDGTAQRFCQVALGEIGYVEEPVNLTKYGKSTMADGLPWCGSFVMWCCTKAGIKIPSVVSTAAGAQKFKDQNRWSEIPQKGDDAAEPRRPDATRYCAPWSIGRFAE